MATTGTRSRVPRPERIDQRKNRAVDVDSAGRAGYHLRMAVVASQVVLHQAEVDVSGLTTGVWVQLKDAILSVLCIEIRKTMNALTLPTSPTVWTELESFES
jgi:hypothetical protein